MERGAYFDAIERGDLLTLRRLIGRDPTLLEARTNPAYAPDEPHRCTGLHAAVHAGRPDVAQILIQAGIDVEARTTEGRTALHDSIELGCPAITEQLLARGAVVDICSAAILGRVERVRELLDDDPRRANDRSTGLSPLGWASFGNQVATAEALIDGGARIDDGELLCAASVGHVEVGELLIDHGASPNEIHVGFGGTALHAAAFMKYTDDSSEFVRMLLRRGADPGIETVTGKTALELARSCLEAQQKESESNVAVECKEFEAVIAALEGHQGSIPV